MRRAVAAIGVTVIAMWLILSFKSAPPTRLRTAISAPAPTTTLPAAGPPPPGPGGSTTTAPSGPSGPRTVTGDVVATRYGDVQVAVVLNGSKIVDVTALQLPFDRSRSQDISNQAAPLLHDEVIQAQSAQIDTIGGATYTSDGYAQSLQSALAKAHA